jgi:hypothetical protein
MTGMRWLSLLLSIFSLVATPVVAQDKPAAPNWPGIQAELETMYKSDQTLRGDFTKMLTEARAKGVEVDRAAREAIWKKINEQDRSNQKRVAEIVDTHGWPANSKVGAQAATAAFLIVQHAELDYQQKYIDKMREAVAAGEAAKQQLALLEDRVLMRQGKPQRYGSQVDNRNGVGLHPVEDPDNLDKRRATMGLGPVCEYLAHFVKQGGPVVYPACVKAGVTTKTDVPSK